jgi:hypothetical protein
MQSIKTAIEALEDKARVLEMEKMVWEKRLCPQIADKCNKERLEVMEGLKRLKESERKNNQKQ